MPLLKDVATVAFCDAQSINDIHEKVLNEATVALLYQSISLGREEFNKFKSLKAVIRIGPGYNNIDINAATELGIAICHTPVECVEENADSAISLILNLFRKIFSLCNFLQNGKKTINSIDQISELMSGSQRIRGSTLGIVGMGSVGIAVALRAKSFGFRVLFYDNNLALGMENALGMERCSNLTELFSQSDCLTLHCPLTSENKHLINLETIKFLKFGAFLVNTSEFDLIESNSLISALKSGNIRSFAIDCDQPKNIFERENYDILCSMPNVICTPKIGWYCQESHNELRVAAAQEVRRALTGSIPEDLKNCVNKSELLTLKGIFKINQESCNNSSTTSNTTLFSKESFNNISPIFPPLLNMQAASLKNCFGNYLIENLEIIFRRKK
ncbi:unnamed protein product [Meloidogyne enterolobii]|uniref:Uncharacterized protein n=3 Tax=Meloidogyne enterolobii TaxID=390850 RepID=A0ACB1AP05_MELEN